MRILLIKLTSLGDLIHVLPSISDACKVYPNIEFDWVIDENFQEVATWHPAVKHILTTNHRGWRKQLGNLETYSNLFQLIKRLRESEYDLVIDGQGNFKTALLSLCTRGIRAGFDKHSVREKIAYLAYQKTFRASKRDHAISRLRQLFAQALNYPLPNTAPNFQIATHRFEKPKCDIPNSYLMFVHNASWKTKLWPEEHWLALIKKATEAGYNILLPWGNAEEEARARRLAISPQVTVLPKLSLSEIGFLISQATACVCMDTGLSHLTAALNIPAITLYGATDSGLIGASGLNQLYLQSTLSCAPCQQKTCAYPDALLNPPCLAEISPEKVFEQLSKLLIIN